MPPGKTLQSTIEISGVLSPSLQAAIKNAVGKLEDMSEETLASAGAAEKLCAEISAQESVLKSLQKGYADFIVSGQQSSDEAQTLADKIQELSGELDENRGTLQAAEKAAQRLAGTQEDTADAYTMLERKIKSQEDELGSLRRQYANVALEQGETSDEARQLANRIESLSGDLNENRQRLKSAEDAAESFGRAVEHAGEQAEDSSEGYTVLKDVISDLAADAIGKAVESFKELATEGDTALAKLEARTGATGEKMQGFEDVMYEVYNANYGESLGDVQEKLSKVIEMTDDLDNASLTKVTKSVIALEDVFGFDVSDSMRAANSLMDQFGITSDEAFNLIVQGAQNGLNQNDDLLDTINEYSVQFKGAGYSADDVFNMLANGAESGTWSVDKLGDAVKEFNIRMSDGTANDYLEDLGVDVDTVMEQFNKGGADAQKAIGTVMDAVLKCDDATLQYQTGVGLFGTMWEDLGADTVASLMDTEGAISKTSNAMEKMDSAAYDTLESSLSQLGRTVKAEVVQPIADRLIPVAKDAADTVTEKVGPAVDWLIDNLPFVGVALGTVGAVITAMNWGKVVSGVGKAVGAFKGIGAALTAIPGPVLAVIAIVAALAAGFAYLWKTNDEFRENMTALWEQLQGVFSELGGVIGNTLSQLAPLIADLATALLESFGQIAATVLPILMQIIIEILPIVISLLEMLLPPILELCKSILPILVDVLGLLSPILGLILSLLQPILDLFFAIISPILKLVTAALSPLLDILVWLINLALKPLQIQLEIVGKVFTFLGNVVGTVSSAIRDKVGKAWSAVSSATSEKWESVRNTVGSKLSAAKERAGALVDSIKNKASNAWSSISSAASSKFESLRNIISEKLNSAKEIVRSAIDKIKGFFNFSWSLPKIKMPHFSIKGKFSLDPPSIPKISVDWYKDGGIMTQPTIFGAYGNTVMAGGEAGAEAILPLSVLWDKMEAILQRILGGQNSTGEPSGAGLTSKAGELLTLDNFSLGSLADGTNVVIYYDFSNFTWSPQIQANGAGDDEDDLMARLRAHEAEFFDWLEEFIQMREVAQYA